MATGLSRLNANQQSFYIEQGGTYEAASFLGAIARRIDARAGAIDHAFRAPTVFGIRLWIVQSSGADGWKRTVFDGADG